MATTITAQHKRIQAAMASHGASGFYANETDAVASGSAQSVSIPSGANIVTCKNGPLAGAHSGGDDFNLNLIAPWNMTGQLVSVVMRKDIGDGVITVLDINGGGQGTDFTEEPLVAIDEAVLYASVGSGWIILLRENATGVWPSGTTMTTGHYKLRTSFTKATGKGFFVNNATVDKTIPDGTRVVTVAADGTYDLEMPDPWNMWGQMISIAVAAGATGVVTLKSARGAGGDWGNQILDADDEALLYISGGGEWIQILDEN